MFCAYSPSSLAFSGIDSSSLGASAAKSPSTDVFQEIAAYFAVGAIAFLLGVTVTLLAFHLKKRRGEGDDEP